MSSDNFTTVTDALGIAQRVPLYVPIGSRPFITKSTANIGNSTSSYASGKCLGGNLAIPTGLPAGSLITGGNLVLRALTADVTTGGTLNYYFSDSAMTAFADGASVTLVATDRDKTGKFAGASWVPGTAGTVSTISLVLPRIAVDGSGNINVLLVVSTTTLFASASCLSWSLDGLY